MDSSSGYQLWVESTYLLEFWKQLPKILFTKRSSAMLWREQFLFLLGGLLDSILVLKFQDNIISCFFENLHVGPTCHSPFPNSGAHTSARGVVPVGLQLFSFLFNLLNRQSFSTCSLGAQSKEKSWDFFSTGRGFPSLCASDLIGPPSPPQTSSGPTPWLSPAPHSGPCRKLGVKASQACLHNTIDFRVAIDGKSV